MAVIMNHTGSTPHGVVMGYISFHFEKAKEKKKINKDATHSLHGISIVTRYTAGIREFSKPPSRKSVEGS